MHSKLALLSPSYGDYVTLVRTNDQGKSVWNADYARNLDQHARRIAIADHAIDHASALKDDLARK